MKICYLADAESIHVKRWVKYFVDEGHTVHIISHNPNQNYDMKNVKVHHFKNIPLFRKIDVIHVPLNIFRIRLLINKINPDILHAHYVTHYGFYGAMSFYSPLIISVWGSDVLTDPIESKVSKLVVSYALKKADIITTTAKFMGSYLCNKFKVPNNKIIRIPWGIDTKILYKGYKKDARKLKENLNIKKDVSVILSSRSMTPRYNIENIIEAIPPVLKSYPHTVFVFIRGFGTSDYEKEMKLKAEQLGVIKNTRFISKRLTPVEMVIYLNIADVFVSLPKTDQFASSLMEGMYCGVVPIVSEIDVYKQYLKDNVNSLMVDPENSIQIADKITYFIENPEIKEKFYKVNKKIIEENEDWERNAQKMQDLYDSFLRRN